MQRSAFCTDTMKAMMIWTCQHNAVLPATLREKATQRVAIPSYFLVKFFLEGYRTVASLRYQHYVNPYAVRHLALDRGRGRTPLRMAAQKHFHSASRVQSSKNEVCHFIASQLGKCP